MPLVPIKSFSAADVVVELSVKDPRAGKPAPLFEHEHDAVFLRATFTEELGAWKTTTLVYSTRRPAVWAERVKPLLDEDFPRLWVRFGLRSGSKRAWNEWDDQLMTKATFDPTGGSTEQPGALLVLVTADLLYELNRLDRAVAWRGPLDSIIRKLAEQAGFTRFAIEPTGPDEVAYVQAYETNLEFIRRLAPAAQNARGESHYLVYARDGIFHFHTPGWQVKEVKSLSYGDQTLNDVSDLKLVSRRHEREAAGGRGVTLVPYDPLTGLTKVYESDAAREMRFTDELRPFDAETYGENYAAHVGQNQARELEARTQYVFKAGQIQAYGLSFTVTNYPFLGVGDILSLSNRTDPAFDGLWLVSKLAHLIDESVLKTAVILCRDSSRSVQTQTATLQAGVDDGRQLNLGELESSLQTQPVVGDQLEPDGSTVKTVLSAR